MKKTVCLLLCLVMLAGLCACGKGEKEIKTHEVKSDLYTQEDIRAAIDVIETEVSRDWKGCTLTEIYYAGDEMTAGFQYEAEWYDADEVIVLISSFDVDSTGGNGSLEPNHTYSGWDWVLVRSQGGAWRHVDHGYG